MKRQLRLCLLGIAALSLGFLVGTAQAIESGSYAAGYVFGAKAAAADVEDASLFEILFASPEAVIPEYRLEAIGDEPAEYQRGFEEGYKANYGRSLIRSPGLRRGLFLVLLGSQVLLFTVLLIIRP